MRLKCIKNKNQNISDICISILLFFYFFLINGSKSFDTSYFKEKKKHWRKKFFLVDFAVLYMIKAKTIKPSIIHPTLYECSVIWSANNNYNKINNNKTYLLHCYCCYIFTTKQKNMYCYFWLRFFSFFFFWNLLLYLIMSDC